MIQKSSFDISNFHQINKKIEPLNLDQISLNEESTNEYLNREIQIINENAVFGIKLLKLIGLGSYGKV